MKNIDYHEALLQSLPDSYRTWFDTERSYLLNHIRPNAKVLDVACGIGRSIKDILPATKNITAIDHDLTAIIKATEQFADIPTVQILHAEAENLPFEDNSFDYVISMGSFMNFADRKYKILSEMKRVLKSDGEMIVSSFSENALEERMKVYKRLAELDIKEIRGGTVIFDQSAGDNISEQFSKAELIDIFTKSELKIIDIKEVSIAYICALAK